MQTATIGERKREDKARAFSEQVQMEQAKGDEEQEDGGRVENGETRMLCARVTRFTIPASAEISPPTPATN